MLNILPYDVLRFLTLYIENCNNIKLTNKENYNFIKKYSLSYKASNEFTWRTRPLKWKIFNIIVNKTKNQIISVYNNNSIIFDSAWRVANADLNFPFYIAKKKNINSWHIYDNKSLLVCKIHRNFNIFSKHKIFKIVRNDGKLWFEISITQIYGPRIIKLYNINSRNYENPIDNENNIYIYNTKPNYNKTVNHDDSNDSTERYGYSLQYKYTKVTLSSIKNFQLKHQEQIIYEFGKTDKNNYKFGYKHPLNGLFAICLAITQIIA